MHTLSDIKCYTYRSGFITFINPNEFLSKIRKYVVYPKIEEIVIPNPVSLDSTYKVKRVSLKLTKQLLEWHAFSLLFSRIRGRIDSPELGSVIESGQIAKMIEEYENPRFAIRLSPNEFFVFDPDMFTYYVTEDEKRATLVYSGKQNNLVTIRFDKLSKSPVQQLHGKE